MVSLKVRNSQSNQNEKEVIAASLAENKLTVSSPADIESLSQRGFGIREDEKLMLTSYEGLHLVEKKYVEVREERGEDPLKFKDLLQRFQSFDENTWVKYLIYRDLRARGYVAREGFGFGVDFRVYERGDYGKDNAKYLILGVSEGKSVSIEQLAQKLTFIQGLKKKLVLAVVNRRGEVVYYTLSQLSFR